MFFGYPTEFWTALSTIFTVQLPLMLANSRGSIGRLNHFSKASIIRTINAYIGPDARISIRDIAASETRACWACFLRPLPRPQGGLLSEKPEMVARIANAFVGAFGDLGCVTGEIFNDGRSARRADAPVIPITPGTAQLLHICGR